MIEVILEVVTVAFAIGGVGSSVYNGVKTIKKKIHDKRYPSREEPKGNLDDEVSEAFIQYRDATDEILKCPKCNRFKVPTSEMEICDCGEFIREHFHRQCSGCKYKFVMRTYDDDSKKK